MIWSLLVLCALIFVHELGHFLFAKWCGVGVVKFSIGFGPALARFRYGETVYQLSIIPLGGFVRMVGDMPDPVSGKQGTDNEVRVKSDEDRLHDELLMDRSRWFLEKNVWQKSSIVFAGPLFNFIFAAVVIFASIVLYGADFFSEEPVIGRVMLDSPAEKAGLKAADRVLTINDKPIASWVNLAELIHSSGGSELAFKVQRTEGIAAADGTATEPKTGAQTELSLMLKPQQQKIAEADGTSEPVFMVGIEPSIESREVTTLEAVAVAIEKTAFLSFHTVQGLWGLVTGQVSPKELAGPIFIFKKTKAEAEKGFKDLLWFSAIISVSLAVLNLLPIPVLDGGHLLFFLLEALLGPISIRKKELAQQAGVFALLMLMVYALHNDLTREEPKPDSHLKWEDSADAKAPEAKSAEPKSTEPKPVVPAQK